MEQIFTVDEVAEILRVKPFTVRQMFRERRLSGFKVGKAWRITESALKTEIDRLKGYSEAVMPEIDRFKSHSDAAVPEIADDAAPEVPKAEIPAALVLEDPPVVQPPPDWPAEGAGHLLIFSDIPGQEVFLDDVKKGPTTLSLTNVPPGEHKLRIGDMAAMVTVYRGVQVRVRRKGEEIAVSVPPEAAQGHADGR